ncbi:hypothetical protein M0R72_08415 [Candidatus Pacearchaeota archaeon]|jgi:hypothetical protein|nr:hypothetical protein [Candidatus Pacearchaeota archaeon]
MIKRAVCNPDKCHKCRHLGRRFSAYRTPESFMQDVKIITKRHCYKFHVDLLEKFGGETVSCEECKVPEYVTKVWYRDCK